MENKSFIKYIQLLLLSIFSRLLILSIGKISSFICVPFDKTSITQSHLDFLIRWDSINFYIIAEHGYISEHILAFFPLYPYIVHIISYIFNISIILSGVLLSNLCFILNSLFIYNITYNIYPRLAYPSFIFFIFSPASILFSTFYTESIFMSFFLLGLKYNFIFHLLSILIRSNGILFIIFYIKKPLYFIITIIIFFLYNYILYLISNIPNTYAYIQNKYWEQGFLRFYTYGKNIPNTFVGLPFLLFFSYNISKEDSKFKNIVIEVLQLIKILFFFIDKSKLRRFLVSKIKPNKNIREENIVKILFLYIKYIIMIIDNDKEISLYIILTFQLFLCAFFVHLHTIFRFISYNPVVYWMLSRFYQRNKNTKYNIIIVIYFTYTIVYTVLFSCYYPPA